jgi:serine/threonine-protein kinase
LLRCLGTALVRQAGNAAVFGVLADVAAEVGAEAWPAWHKETSEPERRAELEAIMQLAGPECGRQIEAVLGDVAAGLPEAVRRRIAGCLEEVPGLLRRAFGRPAGPGGEDPRGERDRAALLAARTELPPVLGGPQDLVAVLAGQPPATPASPAQVVLAITHGPLQGKQFVFAARATCLIGRAEDCHVRLPKDREHQRISRHHCLLEIDLPDLRLRDLDSRNGTWVNGVEIGRRPPGAAPRAAPAAREHDLKDCDEIRLGKNEATVLCVRVLRPPCCAACGAAIPEDQKGECERAPGAYQCAACRAGPTAAWVAPPAGPRTCARCGADVAGQAGTNRPGDFVCAGCRSGPRSIVEQLLERAGAGDPGLGALRGYAVVEELGPGGMAAVYRARRDEAPQEAAVKVMLPRVAASPPAARRFLLEIALTRRLYHPHVVRLWDAGCSGGVFFMLLEYCDGRSVAHRMRQRGGKLSLDEAVEIALQALDGLEYAHNLFGPGKGLVHRDLKPENLFLSGTGSGRVAKLGDYGLAKALDDAGLSGGTMTGEYAGTPAFMPRRQVYHFKDAGPEVDVWALAASLYCMLTGQAPREFPAGKDPWLVVLETEPVPVRRRNPMVPRKLAQVLDLALREEPGPHFATAAAFRQALERAL